MKHKTTSKPEVLQQTPVQQIPRKGSELYQPDNYDLFWADIFALASKPFNPITNIHPVAHDTQFSKLVAAL